VIGHYGAIFCKKRPWCEGGGARIQKIVIFALANIYYKMGEFFGYCITSKVASKFMII
jgi:hypothetical protein